MKIVRRRCGILAAALLLLLAACSQTESPPAPRLPMRSGEADRGLILNARSVRVQDGDSFIAKLEDGRRRTIRLSGIDAPEQAQANGRQSRQNLRRLLDDRQLRIHVVKTDQYGRAVAQVFVVDRDGNKAPREAGLAQLEAGLAWFYSRYRKDLPAASRAGYADAEREARRLARGIWQAGDAEPPWEFRRRQQPGSTDGRRPPREQPAARPSARLSASP